jgi:hypothetical protein
MTGAPAGRWWPWGVAGALLFTVAANVAMIFAATSDGNASVVEPDYYRKAVAWDATMARRAASHRLGWRVAPRIEVLPGDSTLLALEVMATDSARVSGARFVVELIHNRAAATPIRMELAEGEPGIYGVRLALPYPGLWEIRVWGRKGADRFEASLRAEAPGNSGVRP